MIRAPGARRRAALLALATCAACARGPARSFSFPVPQVAPISTPPFVLRSSAPRAVTPRVRLAEALVCVGGDVMLGSNLDTSWARRTYPSNPAPLPLPDALELVSPLRLLVSEADVVVVNVEGAIGSGVVPRKCRPNSTRCYQFRQEPGAAPALRALLPGGEVVGNVANNHAMDAGGEGFAETVERLRTAGVRVTGADTLPTLVSLPSGDTLAVLGFSTFSAGPDARDLPAVSRHVARAAARYRPVLVTVHFGAEGRGAQRTADVVERFAGEDRGNPVAFARAAVEAGAAAVMGHGPHVLRGMEWRGRALVAYSLGNLLTHGPFSLEEPLNRGGFVCAAFSERGGVLDADFRSTYQVPPGVARPDATGRAEQLVDSLSALDFGPQGARVVRGRILQRDGSPEGR